MTSHLLVDNSFKLHSEKPFEQILKTLGIKTQTPPPDFHVRSDLITENLFRGSSMAFDTDSLSHDSVIKYILLSQKESP